MGNDESATSKRSFRYGLRTALFTIFAIALASETYRLGFEHGRDAGPLVPSGLDTNQIYDREYDVSDLVSKNTDSELLVDAIHRWSTPDSWDVIGGYAMIVPNASKRTLTVSHTWPGHVSVVNYLYSIREQKRDNGFTELSDVLAQMITSRGPTP